MCAGKWVWLEVADMTIVPMQSGVHTDLVNGMAWGPANTYLYSGSEDKHVVVWNTGTWECTQ